MIKIFVTIGNDKHRFNRLIDKVVEIDEANDQFLFKIQYGHTKPKSKSKNYKDFISKEQFTHEIIESDLVISHAGAGTLVQVVNTGKKPIVVPRLFKFNEHLNDHQLEIANEFEKSKYCDIILDIDKLEEKIINSNKLIGIKIKSSLNSLINSIKNDINYFLND